MAPPSSRSERQLRLRAAQIAYLDLVTETLGVSLTRVARECGMNPTTLTRFRNDEERGGTLALATLSAVSSYSGVPLPPIVAGDLAETSAVGQLREPEAVPYRADVKDAVSALVASYLQESPAYYAMTVRARTLEHRGILPGDVLIVDMNATPQTGDVVIAQFYDWQRPDQTETAMRIFLPPVLMTATGDQSVDPKPRLVDDRSVGIKGVMLARVGGRMGRVAA